MIENKISVILLMSITLAVFGIFSILTFFPRSLSEYIKANTKIIIELQDSNLTRDSIKTKILQIDGINPKSYLYISKSKGLEIIRKDLNLSKRDFIYDNPLSNVITINLTPFLSNNKIDSVLLEINQMDFVHNTYFQHEIIEIIENTIDQTKSIFFVILFLLAGFVIFFINNNLRLSVKIQREHIKKLRIIGASNSFIRKPFLIASFTLSIISSTIIGAIIFITYRYLVNNNSDLIIFIDTKAIIAVIVSVFIFGIIIFIMSTLTTVNRILEK